HFGGERLPLALTGAPGGGAVTVNDQNSFRLELGEGKAGRQQTRRRLGGDLAAPAEKGEDDLLSFVQKRQGQTLTGGETLRGLLEGPNAVPRPAGAGLAAKLQLVAGLIAKGFGTRIFYVSIGGFDTHADQAPAHQRLLAELADGVGSFYLALKKTGHDG